ncbi:MAG TPA: hypothetical protein VGR26_06465 [Acidimicrobiales bacterium]|nr:hypothetical protein [Acidimicrobiales bacterium]
MEQVTKAEASSQSPELPPAPSRAGLWLGGGLVAGGVLAGVILFAAGALSTGLQSAQDLEQQLRAFARVPVPGQQDLTLEPGGYTVYYEGPGASDDDSERPSFRVALTPASGGNPIPFADYEATLTYTGLGREGRALWTLSVDERGTYRIRVFDASERRGQLAIGPSLALPLEEPAKTAAVVALSGLGAGVAVIVVTVVWRARARHRGQEPVLGGDGRGQLIDENGMATGASVDGDGQAGPSGHIGGCSGEPTRPTGGS